MTRLCLRSTCCFLVLYLPTIQSAFNTTPLFPWLECTARLLYSIALTEISFDNIGQFFRDDAEMILAQTGRYVGIDGITEYSKFLTSKYIKSTVRQAWQLDFVEYDKVANQCVFRIPSIAKNIMDPDFTSSNAELEYAIMMKFYFSFQDFLIDEAHIFLTDDLLALFFDGFLNSENTRNFVCGVREGTCGSYIEEDPPMDCAGALASLPIATNDVYVDGNSQGCRALHGIFAETNPQKHCPHLSFSPQADSDGKLKCQDSEGIKVTELFSEEDLGAFRQFCEKNGLDPDMGHTIPVPQ
jgi:hypothetical protein